MASIHEQIAHALVTYLNGDVRHDDGNPIYTGATVPTAVFGWQPYTGKDQLKDVQILVVPRTELRVIESRCSTAVQTAVDISIRQTCRPTDEAKIAVLDTLVDDIKNATQLAPMASRAWESLANEPLYPRAQLEETAVYFSLVTNVYQHGTG